jgi:hypothetical protein
MMKKLLIGAAALSLVAAGSGYGALSKSSAPNIQKQASLYQIESIERTWHKAASLKNLDLMMSLWAPNSTAVIGGKAYTGKTDIRTLLSKAGPFQPQNHWISDTPAYKIRSTVNGSKGTLYFECHYIDVDTSKVAAVVGANLDVQKINGKWLIVHLSSSTPTLQP